MPEQFKPYCLKRFVRLGVFRLGFEHMKIASVIVAFVAINVMHDFAVLGFGYDTMFKNPATPIASSPLGVKGDPVGLVRLDRCSCGADIGVYKETSLRLCDISTPDLCAGFGTTDLLFVGIESIAVLPPHEVMTHAHFTRRNWPFAVLAIPAYLLASPSVFWGSVALDALVVHEAKAMSGVSLFTSFNSACFHVSKVRKYGPRYKALGNSWAVPVVRWIGERITMVEELITG